MLRALDIEEKLYLIGDSITPSSEMKLDIRGHHSRYRRWHPDAMEAEIAPSR